MGVPHYNETTTTMKYQLLLIAAVAALAIATHPDDTVPEDIRIMPSLVQADAEMGCAGLKDCTKYFSDAKMTVKVSGKKKKMSRSCCCKGKTKFANGCSPKRPGPKKCTCTIKNDKSHKQNVFSSEGSKAVTVKNKVWGGTFRGMTCTGCEYVKVTDADPNTFWGGHAQDIYLGKNSAARHAAKGDKRMKGAMGNNKSCCGKKPCSVEEIAGKVHAFHDLRDDVGEIVMQGAC